MKKYWIKFKKNTEVKLPLGLKMGCGVTARDQAEALKLIKQIVFKNEQIPEVDNLITDVQIDELDKNHVLPNMGNPAFKGIWFPLGYDRQ